jgi:hypothetical protein
MKIWRVRAWAVQAWPRISYYFKASVDTRYQASHEFYGQLLDTIQGNLENWTRDTIEADLTNILEEDTIFFLLDAKPTPTKKAIQGIKAAADLTQGLLSTLLEKIQQEFPRDEYILLLSNIAFPNTYLPDKFAFEFEWNRLKFHKHGSLCITDNADQSKMIIGSSFLIKNLVYGCLLNLESDLSSYIYDPIKKQNLMMVASMIYHAFFLTYKKKLPLLSDNGSSGFHPEKIFGPINQS